MYTKNGTPITFTIQPDSERVNRGWQVDKITAFVQGVEAGYLRISYIPKANFEQFYPSIFNYIAQISGTHLLPYEKRAADWKTLPLEEKQSLATYLRRNFRYYETKATRDVDIEEMSEKTLNKVISKLEKDIAKKDTVGERFASFIEFHVDKPLVDFIRVYDGNEHDAPTTTNFQRQGIGLALYQKGAHYLEEQGLALHASGLQSDEATAAWAYMDSLGWVEPCGKRRTLIPQPLEIEKAAA